MLILADTERQNIYLYQLHYSLFKV